MAKRVGQQEESEGRQSGRLQLHDEVEVAPTLIDVIQGYNVGVLDPKRRDEVVHSFGWCTHSLAPASRAGHQGSRTHWGKIDARR